MLVEDYRPKEFCDVIGLDESIPKSINNTGKINHLLFMGSAGTGKTTTAKIIINKLQVESLELNASDERGINVIREKVKSFAMTQSLNGKFKIIFLDEADFLTPEAQNSLRNLMEKYEKNCRFILTGNYSNKFVEAIKSRCDNYYFKNPTKEQILERLTYVIQKESITNISEENLKKIIEINYPDIRSCIKSVERLSYIEGNVKESDLENISNLDSKKIFKNIVLCREKASKIKKLDPQENYEEIKELNKEIKKLFEEIRQIYLDDCNDLKVTLHTLLKSFKEENISLYEELQYTEGFCKVFNVIDEYHALHKYIPIEAMFKEFIFDM